MEQRLSLVTLGVANLAQARAFYEAMGWQPAKPDIEGVVFFQLRGMILGLFGREDLARDALLDPEGSGSRGISLAYNTRTPEEVDAELDRAVAAGGKLLKPAQKVFWGGYAGYFTDPDGHLWEVAHNPFWQLAADGSVSLPG